MQADALIALIAPLATPTQPGATLDGLFAQLLAGEGAVTPDQALMAGLLPGLPAAAGAGSVLPALGDAAAAGQAVTTAGEGLVPALPLGGAKTGPAAPILVPGPLVQPQAAAQAEAGVDIILAAPTLDTDVEAPEAEVPADPDLILAEAPVVADAPLPDLGAPVQVAFAPLQPVTSEAAPKVEPGSAQAVDPRAAAPAAPVAHAQVNAKADGTAAAPDDTASTPTPAQSAAAQSAAVQAAAAQAATSAAAAPLVAALAQAGGKVAAKATLGDTAKSGLDAPTGPTARIAPLDAPTPIAILAAQGLTPEEQGFGGDSESALGAFEDAEAVSGASADDATGVESAARLSFGAALSNTQGPGVRAGPETIPGLAAQMARRLDGRSSRFDVQLNPAGLGQVTVSVEIGRQGQLRASFAFEKPQTASELKARAGELQSALEQAGFDIAAGGLTFEGGGGVDLAGQGSGRGQAFAQAEERAYAAEAGAPAREAARAAELADRAPRRAGASADGLDIRI